ncbi:GntR family transcriptional regulator [Lapidilactobacillus achengensis]|uniref:GntR family transcriptional regulator n=1 Tax=Lapidilactobacillus achengensis TaxID=2486000 RepID=A0ABW1UKA1_9LACO|nr:GntR family transcriptional regulator [Lapidilactobacillus achengensis]
MDSPVYIKIHNQLKRDIESGIWKVGDRIPSERALSVQFQVSRMTLRQALQTLVEEGILERRVGAGTFVARQKVQEKMSGTTSFTELMRSQGKFPSSQTISYRTVSPSLSEQERLSLGENDKVVRMERIRLADSLPICFEVATIPADMVKNFSRAEVTESFYATMEQKGGYVIGQAKQTITATLASESIADYLNLKRGDAILRLRQITYLSDGRPFEYVRTQYAGQRFEFFLER